MHFNTPWEHRKKSRRARRHNPSSVWHRKGCFIVLEFTGKGGRFRESFWPENVTEVR
jgi:hypothetical protein